uniref:Coiled-coil domain containing 171 n=2 Tax=Mastacembelus armatus TaxID=205130 RepID=A0A3Q3LK77_9TELE
MQLRVRDLEAAVAVERSSQEEAQSSLELLRTKFREVERAYSLERERSDGTERALESLQTEYEQYKSEQTVALETERKSTSDLSEKLEEEKRRHSNTHSLLEQAAQRQRETEDAFMKCVKQIRETLELHRNSDRSPAAEDAGSLSPSAEVLQLLKTTLETCQHRQEETEKQVQDLLSGSERLQEENQALRQLTSEQNRHMQESQQVSVKLEGELTHLRQENRDWSTQSHDLRTELQKERQERTREKVDREREKMREREDREAEVQRITDQNQKESQVRLSFLYRLYQRLLAGCVLLDQPQSILGTFTWEELCDVMSEQVDQLTSDLQKANDKVAQLQSVCQRKSVCVRELQRSQECVLSRLEKSVRRREEAWSRQHTHTVTQLHNELQVCRSQCDSLRDNVSSLELHCSSLTSDLSRVQGLLSRSRQESASFFLACVLLAGALKHTHCRLQTLCEQKTLLSRQLAEREVLQQEVRRLADALGGDGDQEEEGRRRRRAVRRWRRSVCVVLAARRWWVLGKKTTVLFRLERGGGRPALCVCGESATATQKGQDVLSRDGRERMCARWLRSKGFSSTVLSSMVDLQGALTRTGSSPPDVMSAARSGLSRLLDKLLDQSDAASCRVDGDTLSARLRLGLNRMKPPQPNMKTLVVTLQQHFLLFSQRLHSTEVERRSLRLEVANLKRGLRQEREDTCKMVPAEHFNSVCLELRQALNREQEAQMLILEQTNQLHELQQQVNAHTSEQTNTQYTLSQTTQVLSEARQEVSRKERSLRILGKHLSGVQKERTQLEERLQRVENELREASRRQECLIGFMKAAETSYTQVRERLIQSRRSLSTQPQPLPLPGQHLELSAAESIMGTPELAACQTLLSVVSQLFHTCSSRIDWLEQEVSAHRSHVTALRGELQDVCLRDNLDVVPVAEGPKTFLLDQVETGKPADLSSDPPVGLNTAPFPSSPLCKPSRDKTKERKPTKKNRGQGKCGGRRQT